MLLLIYLGCWDSILDIGLGETWQGQKIFLFFRGFRVSLGPTKPSIQLVVGALSQEVKWPGHEADLLPTSSAEVKNEPSCTFPSPICIHVMHVDLHFLYRAVQHHKPEAGCVHSPCHGDFGHHTAFDIAASKY